MHSYTGARSRKKLNGDERTDHQTDGGTVSAAAARGGEPLSSRRWGAARGCGR
jgi:hypothetical protein